MEVLVFSTEFVHSWLRNSYYEILESARRHTKSKHCYILTFRGVEFSYVISLEQEKSALFEYHLNKKKRCYLKYAWWYFHSHFHVTWWNVHKKIWCAHQLEMRFSISNSTHPLLHGDVRSYLVKTNYWINSLDSFLHQIITNLLPP